MTPYATAKLEMEQYYSGDSDGEDGDGDNDAAEGNSEFQPGPFFPEL